MTARPTQGVDHYRAQAAHYEAARAACARLSRRVSYTRLAAFLGAAAVLLSAFPGPVVYGAARVAAGAAGVIIFLALVSWHSRIDGRERRFEVLSRVNLEAAARVERNWKALPDPVEAGPGPQHPFASDLDLFGHASVFQLLGWAGTEPGRATLGRWLTERAEPDTAAERQAAVRELAPLEAAREEFAALGRLIEPGRSALGEFIAWAEAGPWLTRHPWRAWAVRGMPALLLLAAAAQAAGLVSQPIWLCPLGANVVLLAAFGKRTAVTFTRVFSRSGVVQGHAELFARISGAPCEAPRLRAIQAELRASGLTASIETARLARLGQLAEFRRVALFHPIVSLFTLWDLQVLVALESWQRRAAPSLRRWYAALGEYDALAALASLAHDNPSWAFPVFDAGAQVLEADALGHPLIAADRRVTNDVRVGPPGSFLMVTGSNMSGKSTLLRAIGVNVVLAQAGGPVCASRLVMPPLSLCTSMRVQDSLEEGVSYFMAAVRRLKLVVETARAIGPDDPMLLYLLDEVLQGTNTAERQVAVRRILHHLLGLRTLGVVTTHDLELAACDELADACHAVHFSEAVEHHDEGVRLTFDYRLKPGIATSVNALKLLASVGLDTR
jgi:hypothetical protein